MKHLQSGSFYHPELGTVHVAVRANARRLTARWKNGELHVSVPKGLSPERFSSLLADWSPGLLEKKPLQPHASPSYHDFELMSVCIEERPVERPLVITASPAPADTSGLPDPATPRYIIAIPAEKGLSHPRTPAVVARMLDHVASLHASVIQPELTAELSRIGLFHKVKKIKISRGHSILGRCSSDGTIAISSAVVFLPLRLRRLIYCHEIAHLSEMNHSERFHRLLDCYLDGNEKILSRELRSFRWPWKG